MYGPTPAYHDVQLELQGPAVREAEDTFRERWQNPAAIVAAALARRPRPDPRPSPHRLAAPAGVTRSPGRRDLRGPAPADLPAPRPHYPYAPRGERSIALAYTKALGRAEQLIYVEDQYLWSFDVARIFAAALHRSSRLHLIAVVPRQPDNENQFYNEAAMLGTPRRWPWCGRRAATGSRCSTSRT